MKRRFDLRMLLLTLVLSSLGMAACLPLRDSLGDSVPGRAIWCALWFALPLTLGLVGVEAGLAMNRRRFRPARKRSLLAGFLAAVLLGSLIGGGGGVLAMMDVQTTVEIVDPEEDPPSKTDPPEDDPPEDDPPEDDPPEDEPPEDEPPVEPLPPNEWMTVSNIVLLIDASDSVQRDDEAARLAACQMIDALDSEISVQAAVFAYAPTAEDVRYRTELRTLEDGAKEELKEFIQNVDIVGGTTFDGPLQLALKTLKGSSSKDAEIVLFTDGNGTLSQEVYDAVEESGVPLYLVCLHLAETDNAMQLLQLSLATGGGRLDVRDIAGDSSPAAKAQSGSAQEEKPTVASKKASAAREETRTELVFGETLPPDGFGEDISVWRIAVCTVTYILYAVLATAVYYRRITLPGLMGSLCAGCLTACTVSIDQRLCIPVTAVLVLGAYTVYLEKEGTNHV